MRTLGHDSGEGCVPEERELGLKSELAENLLWSGNEAGLGKRE